METTYAALTEHERRAQVKSMGTRKAFQILEDVDLYNKLELAGQSRSSAVRFVWAMLYASHFQMPFHFI